MLRRTEGIVLRTFPFGEADLIATFITPDVGLLKVFVKSPRKMKSRFGSSLEPLTCSRISFWGKEDAALPKLTQCDIIHTFQTIRDDLHAFLKVLEIIELTIFFSPEKDANRTAYLLLANTLRAIERAIESLRGKSSAGAGSGEVVRTGQRVENLITLLVSHFKVKMLKYAGFAPRLDSCGRCGEKGFNFYVSQGAILCKSCADNRDNPIEISAAVKKLYEDLLAWDAETVQRIKPSPALLASLSRAINMHIKYILARPLNIEAFVYSLG